MTRPTATVNHFEKYTTWGDFDMRFQDHVNPVLEWWHTSKGMVDKITGDFALVLIMHHDEEQPFLAELPWSANIIRYICVNAVDIPILPK